MATFKVAASSDDGYYASSFVGNTGQVQVGHWDDGKGGSGDFTGHFRFPNLTIPNGATVTAATLTLYGYAGTTPAVAVNVKAETVDNCSAWGSSHCSGSGLAGVTSQVSTTIPSGSGVGVACTTGDFASVVQAIVGRSGWTSGNALGLLAYQNVGGANTNASYYAYDAGSSGYYPTLTVTWTEGGAPVTTSIAAVSSATSAASLGTTITSSTPQCQAVTSATSVAAVAAISSVVIALSAVTGAGSVAPLWAQGRKAQLSAVSGAGSLGTVYVYVPNFQRTVTLATQANGDTAFDSNVDGSVGVSLNAGTLLVGSGSDTGGTWASTSGVRIAGAQITMRATIVSATLSVKRSGTGSVSTSIDALACALDDSPTWSLSDYPSGRAVTSARTTKSFTSTIDGEAVDFNVTNQVAEVVARQGWSQGNALSFVLVPTTGSQPTFSFYGHPYAARPTLTVVYSDPEPQVLGPLTAVSGSGSVASVSVTLPAAVPLSAVTGSGSVASLYASNESKAPISHVSSTGEAAQLAARSTAALRAASGAGLAAAIGVPNVADPHTQIIGALSCAAFGGTDPYSSTAKGVITRPGDAWIGGRKDVGQGDRVFVRVSAANMLGTAAGVGRATLFLTPMHVMGYRWDSAAPSGDLFAIKQRTTRTGSLDLSALDAATALGYALTETAVPRIQARPTWLAGQMHYDGVTMGNPIDPIAIDVTALYNADLAASRDFEIVLDCVTAQAQTVVEFFGTELAEFLPRIEVCPYEDTPIALTNTDTATPTISVTLPSGASLVNIAWGYDAAFTSQGGTHKLSFRSDSEGVSTSTPYTFPMLETARRVFVRVRVAYDSGRGTRDYFRTFKTPKVAKPALAIPAYSQSNAYTWYDVRRPCMAPPLYMGEAWYVLAQKTSGSAWNLWRATQYQGEYRFWEVIGGCKSSETDPNPTQGATGDCYYLNVTADSVGHPYYDHSSGSVYFLSSHLVNGQYEVRLTDLVHSFGSEPTYYSWWQPPRTYIQQLVYTTTSGVAPDLRNSSITRTFDWRSVQDGDIYQPLMVAFVADGAVKVYSKSAWMRITQPWNPARTGTFLSNSGSWTLERDYTGCGTISDVRFLHVLTESRAHYTVVSARGSVSSPLASRSDDVITMRNDGAGGYTRSGGTWTGGAVTSYLHAYAGEPSLSFGVNVDDPARPAHRPDVKTAAVVALSAGKVRTYDALCADTMSGDRLLVEPEPDWGNALTFNDWMIPRMPLLTGYDAMMHTAHGGAVLFKVSGTTLNAYRIQDTCRVSDEASLTLPASATTVLAQTADAWEGTPCPVLVGESGSWRVVTVNAGTDISRLDCPTPDMLARFRSGSLTTANFLAPASNMAWPNLTHLPGHNCFAASWRWDRGSYVNGLMDNAGWFYGQVSGVFGQSLKLYLTQTSVSRGQWVDGTFVYRASYFPGTPEVIGGMEWPMAKWDTLFYSYDSPSTPNRRWHRMWDVDWHYDGETNGGVLVVQTPTFIADDVWISHDLVFDIDTYMGEFAAWRQNPLVKCTNNLGELLYGGAGASADQPASQALVDVNGRKYTSWRPDCPMPNMGLSHEGENFKGFVIASGGSNPMPVGTQKQLLIISGGEDIGEQTGHVVIRGIVSELLSGSALASSLLSRYVFAIIPFKNQGFTRIGHSRYSYDTVRSNGVVQWSAPGTEGGGNEMWNGVSCIGDEFISAWKSHWLAETGRGGDGYAGMNTWHSDTHFRIEQTSWPYVTPYVSLSGWPKDRFRYPSGRPGFNGAIFPESYSPNATMESHVSDGLPTQDGADFYFELPWR